MRAPPVGTEAPALTVSTHTSVGVPRGSVVGTVRQVSVVIGYSDVKHCSFSTVDWTSFIFGLLKVFLFSRLSVPTGCSFRAGCFRKCG